MPRLWLIIGLLASLSFLPPAQPSAATSVADTTTVLYDGTLGTTPDQQQLIFLPQNADDPPTFPVAEQAWADGATTLTTTVQIGDLAGYITNPISAPAVLNRNPGFTLQFITHVLTETHTNNNRAGFSVLALSSDLQGIELGFWTDRIWAQEGGVSPNLFTQAESVTFTTNSLITYSLNLSGTQYALSANGSQILSGPLRNYTAFSGNYDPYETPNFIFVGDDTSSASTVTRFAALSVTTVTLSNKVYLPLLQK